MVPLHLDKPRIPEVDLAFAISTTALNSGDNLKKTKEVIKDIVKMYGINKVHYSLATFGDKLDIALKFNLKVDSNSQFMAYVDSVPNVKGRSDLAAALEASPSIFTEENGGRPSAKKVLVVVVDNKSESSENDIEDAVRLVKDAGVRLIPVGLDQADNTELQTLTLVEEDVLTPSRDEPADNIAKDIMDRALNGKYVNCIMNIEQCLTERLLFA